MATTAQFTAQPTLEITPISTANTGRDGSGTITAVAVAPSTGAGPGVGKRISRVVVQATGTTTAGMIRFFLSLDGGTTWRLYAEAPVTARTPSGTVDAFRTEVEALVGLMLPGGNLARLGAAPHNAETFVVTVEAGLF